MLKRFLQLCGFILFASPSWGALAIERMALHQFEDGPVLESDYEFLPGETAYFSCRVSGYLTKDDDLERHVKVSWDMRVLDPAGVLLDKPVTGKVEETLTSNDKNWYPKFLASFAIPPFAPSGTYRIPVHIKDEIGSKELSATFEFKVRGHVVEPSETLIARNFKFVHSDEDSNAMTAPIYHPGQMLWAKFDIIGFKLGDKNQYSVDYGLAIENGEGKQLFSQPNGAEDKGESYYPKRYIPGVLSLSLDSGVAKGTYTLVVILRDQVGKQLREERQAFQVE
jgi:hypothetical protein